MAKKGSSFCSSGPLAIDGIIGAIFAGAELAGLAVVVFLNMFSPSSSDEDAKGDGSCWVGGVCLPIEVGALIFKAVRLLFVCKRGASLFETCVGADCVVEVVDSSLFA